MTLTFTHSWPIAATPERVFKALTDPADLVKWFAEGAMVEPRVSGVYRFWGRHTLFTPPEDSARQTISHYQPVTRLGFNWPLNEVDTNVTLDLAPEKVGTRLTLTHRVFGDLLVPRQKELIEDHWRLAIANLTAYLAGTPSFTLPDYFAQHPEVWMTIAIEAPPSAVFRVLIEADRIDRWFGAKSAVVEPRPTHIMELVPDEKLVLDWPDWRGDTTITGQTITFQLAPDGKGGTTLTLVHAGFARTADMGDYEFGWHHFLDMLQAEALA